MTALRVLAEPPEIWGPIAGFEGLYEISTLGRVRSLDRMVTFRHRYGGEVVHQRRGTLLKPTHCRNGRPIVSLARDGVTRSCPVVTIVLETFVGPRPRNFRALALDGDNGNCALSNLSWHPRGSTRARLT